MSKFLSLILSPFFYIYFFLNLIVFHPFFVLSKFIFGEKGIDICTSLFNLSAMRSLLILGTKIKFNGFDKLPKKQPILFISNHQSMWDIPALMWKFRTYHLKFIVKKELAKYIPSVSYVVKYGGSVPIDRSDPKSAIEDIASFSKKINQNSYSICIFPEGTRSKNGKLAPFKKSGIATILKEVPNILVVPIAIKNTGKIDNKGKFLKNIGVEVTYYQLPSRHINIEYLENELNSIRSEIKKLVE